MTVDRLTHIRDNWQEKGNGPRGRDVDFLLGLLDEHPRCEEELEATTRLAYRYRKELSALVGALEEDGCLDRREDLDDARAVLALPATESAQPEEESG